MRLLTVEPNPNSHTRVLRPMEWTITPARPTNSTTTTTKQGMKPTSGLHASRVGAGRSGRSRESPSSPDWRPARPLAGGAARPPFYLHACFVIQHPALLNWTTHVMKALRRPVATTDCGTRGPPASKEGFGAAHTRGLVRHDHDEGRLGGLPRLRAHAANRGPKVDLHAYPFQGRKNKKHFRLQTTNSQIAERLEKDRLERIDSRDYVDLRDNLRCARTNIANPRHDRGSRLR